MAGPFVVTWVKQGNPAGFFVARYDLVDDTWWIIDGNGYIVDTLVSVLASGPSDLAVHPGLLSSNQTSLSDDQGKKRVAVAYGVMAYYSSAPYLVPRLSTLPPDQQVNAPDDSLAIMDGSQMYENVELSKLEIVDDGGTDRGVIEPYQSPHPDGRDYDFFGGIITEVMGATKLRFNGDVLVHDIAPNVLIWG